MTALSCRIATTQRQLDDAVRIRWDVFGRELGLLDTTLEKAPREVNTPEERERARQAASTRALLDAVLARTART